MAVNAPSRQRSVHNIMKVLSVPSSGKISNTVAYISSYGQCYRTLVVPRNERTPARQRSRGSFGNLSGLWRSLLTQQQRDAWNVAGSKVRSAKRLDQEGPLTGQQHFQGICSARACIGKEMLLWPPAPVVFSMNQVGKLTITNVEGGARLLLRVSGPVVEDIMVFGQAPCSAGRSKRRNVAYLGLLPPPQNGMSDITDIYVARYGEPNPGTKIFILTRQQKDGWEGLDHETNEIVPEKPTGQQAASTVALTLFPHMHKGCTRDAQGTCTMPVPEIHGSSKLGVPGGQEAGKPEVAGSQAAVAAMSGVGQPKLATTPSAGDGSVIGYWLSGYRLFPFDTRPLSVTESVHANCGLAGTPTLPAGSQSAYGGENAVQEGVRIGRATGNIDIHRDDLLHAAQTGVVLAKDTAAAPASPDRHDQPRLRRGVICLPQGQLHVARYRAGHEQHVGMARRGNKVNAEPLDVIHRAVQPHDLQLATVARPGIHFADVQGTA
jgi:hypothetical protein